MAKLIDQIQLPQGLRALALQDLSTVCNELREELIESVSRSGGHFASSLGATEISVALHYCLNTPSDKIVWDVGHQAYIHKMLTGRRDRLSSIRKKNGLSGFLKREESEYDCFGAGHAGTSISAAVGMCVAADPNSYVCAVIGDGSMTSGMAFEALNHAGSLALKNLIVILNDNEMSISQNVGAISWLLSKALTSKTSTAARSNFKALHKKGFVPDLVYKAIDRAEELAQSFLASPAMLFESFGFRYIGPVDGHCVESLVQAINNAKQQDVPVLIHVRTKKGRGFEPAEEDPIKWHGVTPFDRSKGVMLSSTNSKPAQSFTACFADALIDLAKSDANVVAITAAMLSGTGLDKFSKEFPDRCYDVGICEQHAVTFAAGLACQGKVPVCAIYSTFLQRGFDQVVHDVCIQNLPVIFALDRAGAVGNDGETHQGLFDISYLRSIPNIVLMAPKDEVELRQMLFSAVDYNCPVAIRYPRGNAIGVPEDKNIEKIELGKAELITQGKDALIIAYGPLVYRALEVSRALKDSDNLDIAVVNARFAKPLDQKLFAKLLSEYKEVVVLEDHALSAGFSSALLELVNDLCINSASIKRIGFSDQFVAHATQDEQHAQHGLDTNSIIKYIREKLSNFNQEQRARINLKSA